MTEAKKFDWTALDHADFLMTAGRADEVSTDEVAELIEMGYALHRLMHGQPATGTQDHEPASKPVCGEPGCVDGRIGYAMGPKAGTWEPCPTCSKETK
jgi:hypothetical protein